jgi:hypothetical protein
MNLFHEFRLKKQIPISLICFHKMDAHLESKQLGAYFHFCGIAHLFNVSPNSQAFPLLGIDTFI